MCFQFYFVSYHNSQYNEQPTTQCFHHCQFILIHWDYLKCGRDLCYLLHINLALTKYNWLEMTWKLRYLLPTCERFSWNEQALVRETFAFVETTLKSLSLFHFLTLSLSLTLTLTLPLALFLFSLSLKQMCSSFDRTIDRTKFDTSLSIKRSLDGKHVNIEPINS